MAPRALFELTNIYKAFPVEEGEVVVLKEVNLSIHDNEFVAIFGPSGCGKTTLLNTITGLEPPTGGQVKYLGFDLTKATEDEFTEFRKNNVGMLYQQQHWIHSLNVLDNVAFPLILHGVPQEEARKRALQKLTELGMEKWAAYKPNRLSSGQQQRVGLARALVSEPSIVIADEPTGNLDRANSDMMMAALDKLHQAGKTILMVTHNVDHLAHTTRILQMLDGYIIQQIDSKGMSLDAIKKTLDAKAKLPSSSASPEKAKAPKSRWNVLAPLLWIGRTIASVWKYILLCFSFLILIATYWISNLVTSVSHLKYIPRFLIWPFETLWKILYKLIVNQFDRGKLPTIKRIQLIDLGLRSLRNKFLRSAITIGGMGIGIGAIVFLVSIGYGLEKLVLQRVAQLNEMEQFEVTATATEQRPLDQTSITAIREITYVSKVYPLISVAGRASYQNSKSDIVVFGVQADYLRNSSLPIVGGDLFTDNEVSTPPGTLNEEALTNTIRNEDGSVPVTLSVAENRSTVINSVFAGILGLSPRDAVGKQIAISFVVTGPLVQNKYKITSNEVPYTIRGVINDGDSPYIYVPITDVQALGLPGFSQLTVGVTNQERVPLVRQKVEALGFQTNSILDTINQIETLFRTIRLVLLLIGTAALLVAAFGMFNTLTVSLLERTREIGLMKSLGMKSGEVKELFLTESMQMGLIGGFLGLGLGFLGGQILSVGLSAFSFIKGGGFLGITFIPWYFIVAIIVFSVLVGITTGIFPSRRAARISALQALLNE